MECPECHGLVKPLFNEPILQDSATWVEFFCCPRCDLSVPFQYAKEDAPVSEPVRLSIEPQTITYTGQNIELVLNKTAQNQLTQSVVLQAENLSHHQVLSDAVMSGEVCQETIRLDPVSHMVYLGDQGVELSVTIFKMLGVLMTAVDQPLSTHAIVDGLGFGNADEVPRLMQTLIAQLDRIAPGTTFLRQHQDPDRDWPSYSFRSDVKDLSFA